MYERYEYKQRRHVANASEATRFPRRRRGVAQAHASDLRARVRRPTRRLSQARAISIQLRRRPWRFLLGLLLTGRSDRERARRPLVLDRRLGGVVMLGAGKHLEMAELLAAERALRQHALNRLLHNALGDARLQLLKRLDRHAARTARVAEILLLVELGAGDDHLVRVDHDHVVTHVRPREKGHLVLPHQTLGDLRRHPAEAHALSVDHPPLLVGVVHVRSLWHPRVNVDGLLRRPFRLDERRVGGYH
mmetsp:Transcript_13015/g.40858  ORF Transcript_13015/g.40858 Transcript_13015/m.40858 type:complete len:248 (-) Transcript_13015:150-893(-)